MEADCQAKDEVVIICNCNPYKTYAAQKQGDVVQWILHVQWKDTTLVYKKCQNYELFSFFSFHLKIFKWKSEWSISAACARAVCSTFVALLHMLNIYKTIMLL